MNAEVNVGAEIKLTITLKQNKVGIEVFARFKASVVAG